MDDSIETKAFDVRESQKVAIMAERKRAVAPLKVETLKLNRSNAHTGPLFRLRTVIENV